MSDAPRGSAACTTIYCQKCKRATDDPAHKFGCDCACNRPTNRKVPILDPIPHDDESRGPWWATWWGRLLSRCGLTLLSEANDLAVEKNRWQREISDALDMTVEDHGTWHIDLDRAVAEIKRLRERANAK